MAQVESVKTSSPALIAAAWIVVLIPAAWGLNYTVGNAMKLFKAPPPAVTAPASTAPASTAPAGTTPVAPAQKP